MNQEEYLEWTLLRHLPDIHACIIGLSDGEIRLVPEYLVWRFRNLIHNPIFASTRSATYVIPISPERTFYLDDESNDPSLLILETEEVSLHRLIVSDEYEIHCGFGSRTKTWIVARETI